MCMDERNVSKPAMRGHKLVLNNRTASLVTGVKDVLSFDLNEVLLETEQGMLMVEGGRTLHVNRAESGKRRRWICPEILTVLHYSDVHAEQKQGENLFARLFR